MRGVVLGLLLANFLYAGWHIFLLPAYGYPLHDVRDLDFSPEGIANIDLLSEAPKESLRHFGLQSDGAAVAAATEGVDSTDEDIGNCIEMGPLDDFAQAQEIIDAFATIVPMSIELRSVAGPIDYRVYLPPFPSAELAGQALTTLQSTFIAANLSIDSFLVARGELANGIALGLFSEQRNAFNVREQMRALGYEVVVREEVQIDEKYWIFSEQFDSKEVFDSHWAEHRSLAPDILIIEKLCQTIAQESQFP